MLITPWTLFKPMLLQSLLAGCAASCTYLLIAGIIRLCHANQLPARYGFPLLYFLPLVALAVSARSYFLQMNTAQALVFAAVFIHFTKRVLECLLLHKYSSPSKFAGSVIISGLYSLAAFLIGTLNQTPLPLNYAWSAAGITLYLLGISGNYYHHKKLAGFRANSMEYVIPNGGLFDLIICPHYLFEFIGWVGVFLLSRHFGTLLVIIAMLAYLIVRALITLQWYRDTFPEFPKDRRAMIPYIL